MESHPGIVFRDGPTGCRAGLAAGPDVWEIIRALRDSGLSRDEAVEAVAEFSSLSVGQVNDAIAYYNDRPSEVDARIGLEDETGSVVEPRLRLSRRTV